MRRARTQWVLVRCVFPSSSRRWTGMAFLHPELTWPVSQRHSVALSKELCFPRLSRVTARFPCLPARPLAAPVSVIPAPQGLPARTEGLGVSHLPHGRVHVVGRGPSRPRLVLLTTQRPLWSRETGSGGQALTRQQALTSASDSGGAQQVAFGDRDPQVWSADAPTRAHVVHCEIS